MQPARRAGPPEQPQRLRRLLRAFVRLVPITLLIAWCLPPISFVYYTLHPGHSPIRTRLNQLPFPAEAVAFPTADGVTIRGWLGRAAAAAPVILFGHGYPGSREQMIPYADLLYQAGYSVLLFDWRGWGASGGDMTTFGLHEPDDLRGALNYLSARPDLHHPRFGGLGVSYGAGLMLIGAAHDHRLAAVVCDSTYPRAAPMFTQWDQIGLTIWPHRIPMAPLGTATANLLLDGRLDDLAPLRQAVAVSPSALLLIHSDQDGNPLTPAVGTQALYAAAQQPKALWVAPLGEHAGILFADPTGYRSHVIAFFDKYLRNP